MTGSHHSGVSTPCESAVNNISKNNSAELETEFVRLKLERRKNLKQARKRVKSQDRVNYGLLRISNVTEFNMLNN